MAFIQNNQNDEEKDKEGAPGQQPGGTSGILSSSATPTNSTPNKTQSFATLQKYLTANKPQAEAFAGQIANNATGTAEAARSGINQFANSAIPTIQSKSITPDAGLINSVLSNPLSATQEQKNAFTKQRTGSYEGPTDLSGFEGYNAANEKLAKATETRNLLDTEGGRKQLVANEQQNKGAGITALNQALVSAVPTARQDLENAKGNFSGLQDLFQGASGNVTNAVAQAKQQAQEANALATGKGNEAVSKFKTGLDTRLTDARAKEMQDADLQAKLLNAGNYVGPGQVALDPTHAGNLVPDGQLNAALTDMGLTKDEFMQLMALRSKAQTGYGQGSSTPNPYAIPGVNIDLRNFFTKTPSDVMTLPNVATPEDYQTAQALAQLTGNDTSLPGQPQPGFNSSAFNKQAAFDRLNPISDAITAAAKKYLEDQAKTNPPPPLPPPPTGGYTGGGYSHSF